MQRAGYLPCVSDKGKPEWRGDLDGTYIEIGHSLLFSDKDFFLS
jgi:hypothetical protein